LKRKRIGIWFFVISLALLLSGCTRTNRENADRKDRANHKIQIGMCFDSFVIERWQRDRDVFVSMAEELGAQVNVQNANGNVAEQKSTIEYFINKKMDAIVIIPIDVNAISKEVLKAREKGIKVISYDRLIANADTDLYISFDNVKVGKIMADGLINAGLPRKKVIMICGPLTDHNVSLVNQGFCSEMQQHNIDILDKVYANGWLPEQAESYIYDHIDTVKKVDGIMFGNDSLASQGIRALSEKRVIDQVKVVGQDAELAACQRIVEGTQLMTVFKPVDKLAKEAVKCTIRLVKGEKTDTNKTIYDGKYNVPYIAVNHIAVNKDNMKEVIIDGGFHRKEDVYLNVPKYTHSKGK
jgi:D-xylose transport system substrate-binding protein